MRAFVALDVSEPEALAKMIAFQRDLMATGADLKAVERENLHFTVKFLGEVSDEAAKLADSRLKGLKLEGAAVFIGGVGAFPSLQRPSVVWAGVPAEDEPKVRSIADVAIQALEGIGERDDRGFRPHITMARVKSGRNRSELASLIEANADRTFGRVQLSELKLKSSRLTPRGPVYSDIGVYPLQ